MRRSQVGCYLDIGTGYHITELDITGNGLIILDRTRYTWIESDTIGYKWIDCIQFDRTGQKSKILKMVMLSSKGSRLDRFKYNWIIMDITGYYFTKLVKNRKDLAKT